MMAIPQGLRSRSGLGQYEDYKGYLLGLQPLATAQATPAPATAVGGVLGSAQAGGGTQAAPPSTLSTQEPQASVSQRWPTSTPFAPQAGSSASGIFGNFDKRLTATEKELQGLGSTFREQAGPSRDYQGIGAAGTLEQAISPQGNLDLGRELVGAQYGGPSGLDTTAQGRVQEAQQELATEAGALRTGGGVQNLLMQGTGLTPGEARYEAQGVWAEPGYQQAARERQAQAARLGWQIQDEAQAARTYAQGRRAEEEAIRTGSRNYLTKRKGDIYGDLDRRVADAVAQNRMTRDQYNRFMETGDLSILPEDIRRDYEGTPAMERRAEAEKAWGDIWNQYPEIAGIGTGNLRVSRGGIERVTMPGEGLQGAGMSDWMPGGLGAGAQRVLDPSLTSQERRGEARGVRQERRENRQAYKDRQRALEEQFGSGTSRNPEAGPYADVLPMYDYSTETASGYGPDNLPPLPWERPDLRNYLGLDEGLDPHRGHMASDEERIAIDRIGQLLDEADRIAEAGEPWRAAVMMADMERLIEDENTAVESAAGERSEKGERWRKLVRKVRKQYKKAKENSRWGVAMDIIGGAMGWATMGAGNVFGGPAVLQSVSNLARGGRGLQPMTQEDVQTWMEG